MSPGSFGAAAAIVAIFGTNALRAQTSTQVVRFQVNAVSEIGISGSPAPIVINAAAAGSAPTSVASDGTSYAITTNESNQKITASLDRLLPSGLTLEVLLAAPPGATSTGSVALSTASADVVTGISMTASTSLPIRYRLSATPAAGTNAPEVRTVTFTIVAGP